MKKYLVTFLSGKEIVVRFKRKPKDVFDALLELGWIFCKKDKKYYWALYASTIEEIK